MGLFDKLKNKAVYQVVQSDNPFTAREVKKEYNKTNFFYDDYIVFDLETTGYTPDIAEIIEIGAIKFLNNEKTTVFHSFVKPKNAIPKQITSLTGITNENVKNAPDIRNVLSAFSQFIGNDTLIAHNASFDMRFLQTMYYCYHGDCLKNPVIDTLKLAREYLPKLENHKIENIKKYFNISVGSHNAVDDCQTTAVLYQYCLEQSRAVGTNRHYTKSELKALAPELLKQVHESLNIICSTANPKVFFERYNLLMHNLEELSEMENFIRFSEPKPSELTTNIIVTYQASIKELLDRMESKTKEKISKMKTSRGVINNIKKFTTDLELYLSEMDDDTIAYKTNIENSLNAQYMSK